MSIEYYIFIGMGVAVVGAAITIGILQNKRKVPPVIIVPEKEKPIEIPNPVKLNWPDRRAIASIHLSSAPDANNPYKPGDRRWKLCGQFQFSREALMAHADNCVAIMKDMNAQGMVTWNIEGEEFYHPYSYIGDPRLLPPEMEPFADEYFAKFKGFKTGVCLRADEVRITDGWPKHYIPLNWVVDLSDKITYAQKRWGCTLFYVDSNVGIGMPAGADNTIGAGNVLPANVFSQLRDLHPDCLIMPEHYDYDYFNYTAPWCDGRWKDPFGKGQEGTFKVVSGAKEELLPEIVKNRDILMFSGWWADPYNQAVKQAYAINK